MEYDIEDLKKEIRVALDQNMSSTALSGLEDVDTLSLDELIESKIEDAAVAVVRSAPLILLYDVGVPLNGDLSIESNRCSLPLPADFLRLLRFKLTSWTYAIYDVADADSSLYLEVHSPYGVRGNTDRPIAFIVPGEKLENDVPVPCQIIEAYSSSGVSDTLDGCLYVKKPTIVGNVDDKGNDDPSDDVTTYSIILAERLKRPTVYYAAYLVALAIHEQEVANSLLSVCNELMK